MTLNKDNKKLLRNRKRRIERKRKEDDKMTLLLNKLNQKEKRENILIKLNK